MDLCRDILLCFILKLRDSILLFFYDGIDLLLKLIDLGIEFLKLVTALVGILSDVLFLLGNPSFKACDLSLIYLDIFEVFSVLL